MKKVKVLLVGILTLVLSLFCLVGCFEQGKYMAKEVVYGSTSTKLEDSESYVELKDDEVAVVSISIDIPIVGTKTIEGEGTWAKGEEKGEYVVTVGGIEYDVTIDGKEMTLTIPIVNVQIVLEK